MFGWSSISLFLQIAIVVVAVLLFSIFDPFGILNTKKRTLEHTPVSVQSIKEIGQLISAEYYGEVLTSLQEAIIEETLISETDEETEMKDLWDQFEYAIYDLRYRKDSLKVRFPNRGKKLLKIFYRDYPRPTDHPYYEPFIKVLASGEKEERKLIRELFDEKDKDIEKELTNQYNRLNLPAFKANIQKMLNIKTADKKFRKSQIVVLGRGWVKAGIDFGTFNERNFKYEPNSKTIHLVGMKPEILVCNINPWFIPEEKVKGFEVVVMTRKARKPEYMLKVKELSLKKLRQKAIRAGIIEQAKTNAEENLKNFFNLLLPEGIDEVIIHDDFFSYFDVSFMDETLTPNIMQSIDSLFVNRYVTDSAEVMSLKSSLEEKKIFLGGSANLVNRYSSKLSIVEDEVLSAGDLEWISEEKKRLETAIEELKRNKSFGDIPCLPDRLDSIWLYPDQAKVDQYMSDAKGSLDASFLEYETLLKTKDYRAYVKNRDALVARQAYLYMTQKKLHQLEQFTVAVRAMVSQIVQPDGVTVVKSKAPPSINKELGVEYVSEFRNDHLAVSEDGAYIWRNVDVLMMTLDSMNRVSDFMIKEWPLNPDYVLNLRDQISDSWEFFHRDTLLKVGRYSTFYQYVSGSTLSGKGLQILHQESKSFGQSDSLLNQVDEEDQTLVGLSTANPVLDQVWFYPPTDSLKAYKEEADEIEYGFFTSVKKRKRIRTIYQERRIQQAILRQRKEKLPLAIENIMTQIDSLKTPTRVFVRQNGKFDNLPDSLSFMMK